MDHQIIFRFENKKGIGAYQYCEFDQHTASSGHPGPNNDLSPEQRMDMSQNFGLIVGKGSSSNSSMIYISKKLKQRDHDKLLFGFKDMKQAYTWFRKYEIKEMLQNKISLVAYRVPADDVLELGRQVVYNKNKAILIK